MVRGGVEKLSGLHLLRVTGDTNPAYHVRRFLTAALRRAFHNGVPIRAKRLNRLSETLA